MLIHFSEILHISPFEIRFLKNLFFVFVFYRCKLTTKASPRSLKRPPKTQKQPEQLREEVIVVDRRHVQERYSCDGK